MKKSVVILIAIIYISAIALVSFFGLKHKVFDEVVPVSSIEIINDGVEYNADTGSYKTTLRPDEEGVRAFRIEYRVHPDNASEASVSFTIDSKMATVDDSGLVVFDRSGTATVFLTANDGTGVSTKIIIVSR